MIPNTYNPTQPSSGFNTMAGQFQPHPNRPFPASATQPSYAAMQPQAFKSPVSAGHFSPGFQAMPALQAGAVASSSSVPPSSQGFNQFSPSAYNPSASSSAVRLPMAATAATATRLGPIKEAISPAKRTGDKVGALVTSVLEENPELQAKIDNINLDELTRNFGPTMEKMRVSVNQALNRVPRMVDNFIIRRLPLNMQEQAKQFDEWLRKAPDPRVLAALQREKRQASIKQQMERLNNEMEAPLSPEDEAPAKKPSFIRRMASKLWPFGKSKAEAAEPIAGRGSKRASEMDELDALLSQAAKKRSRPV